MVFIDYRISVKSVSGKTESFYVNTLYGEKLVIDGNSWFLYVGSMSVACGDIKYLADKGKRNDIHYYGYAEPKDAFFF